MNHPAPFYNASEKLARKLKVPVVYADMLRISRGHYEVNFILLSDAPESLPENELTGKYVKLIEDGINRSLAEYLWSHKRRKHKPPENLTLKATHT